MTILKPSSRDVKQFTSFFNINIRKLATILCLFTGTISTAQADVVTSVRPLAFIAAAITDGITETNVLLPDGVSPHSYAMRPSDIQRLSNADLFIWIGPDMEVFLTQSIKKLNKNQYITLTTIPQITQLIAHNEEDQDEENHANHGSEGSHDIHDHHTSDMHIWMSPQIARQIATVLSVELAKRYPSKQNEIKRNLHEFNVKLEQTEEKIGNMLIPFKRTGYFVFHDAYGYFERSFGLAPLGYFTINPEIQPGAQRLNQIREILKQNRAECIFSEPQFKPKVIETVTRGTHVRHGILDPLGSNIELHKNSYMQFLEQLSQQFANCLKHDV